MKVVKKSAKPRKASAPKATRPKDWRDAVRWRLSKVPAVDAVFVNTASDTVHVYSIFEKFTDDPTGRLLKEESRVEKAFPNVSFEFHTRAHQGREPSKSCPWGSELVYLR